MFTETIGNPRLYATDLETVAKIAHEHNIPLVIDHTVAMSYLVKPILLEEDIVIPLLPNI
ncbi:PLP-dependent transferase [[Clostridium] scindens]|uniref:PLP-dependent transferase n=1 Tax=Clostridium scindens (strain JCM 10418 / VPI 12708) TaxID=29347 RepID=UPI003A7F5280